uniref:Uncharacterized protein n=1 Tax=Cryptomonas curvata TaxID=233186 RepID=A0A7S0QCI9_9CRYP
MAGNNDLGSKADRSFLDNRCFPLDMGYGLTRLLAKPGRTIHSHHMHMHRSLGGGLAVGLEKRLQSQQESYCSQWALRSGNFDGLCMLAADMSPPQRILAQRNSKIAKGYNFDFVEELVHDQLYL